MDNDRWSKVHNSNTEPLTPEEIAEGWHFCLEWDGLLVGPGMDELKYCNCFKPLGGSDEEA
jgi:hypothetical protein